MNHNENLEQLHRKLVPNSNSQVDIPSKRSISILLENEEKTGKVTGKIISGLKSN